MKSKKISMGSYSDEMGMLSEWSKDLRTSPEVEEKTMTVKEVAEVFQCGESSIKRAIEKLRPVLGVIPVNEFGGYMLNEIQITALKLEMKKHHNLENTLELPKMDIEMSMILKDAAQYFEKKYYEAKEKLIEAQPAIEYYNMVADSTDTLDIGEVAKILGYGRNNFFKLLREEGILTKKNVPYQNFLDLNYFKVILTPFLQNGEPMLTPKTLVYNKGLEFLTKIVKNNIKGE